MLAEHTPLDGEVPITEAKLKETLAGIRKVGYLERDIAQILPAHASEQIEPMGRGAPQHPRGRKYLFATNLVARRAVRSDREVHIATRDACDELLDWCVTDNLRIRGTSDVPVAEVGDTNFPDAG